MPKRKWTAVEVVDALREAFGVTTSNLVQDEWSMFTEVPLRASRVDPVTGKPIAGFWGSNERRIDVLLVRNWSGGTGHERIGIEVKVSRADYRNEHEAKRQPVEQTAHRTVYATPAGLITPEELHPGWGLIEIHESHEAAKAATGRLLGDTQDNRNAGIRTRCTWRKPAEHRTPATDMEYLVASIARQGSRAVERLRRGESDADKVPGLQADVERLAGQLDRRDEANARLRQQVASIKSELLRLDGAQECADCREPVTWNPAKGYGGVWAHKDKAQERKCQRERQEAARLASEARTGARYLSGYVGHVEPVAMRALVVEEAEDVG